MSPGGVLDEPALARVGMSVDRDLYRQSTYHIWVATNRVPRPIRKSPWLSDQLGPLILGTLQVPHPALGPASAATWEEHTDRTMWLATLRNALAVNEGPVRRLLVLVHGFDNSLPAASETARYLRAHVQNCEVLLFSWPSEGVPLPGNYTHDRQQAMKSVPALQELLHDVLAPLSVEVEIDIVAHSLGSEILLRSVPMIAGAAAVGEGKPRFRQVVFISPDVDSEEFQLQIPPVIREARRVTVYGHEDDKALNMSGPWNLWFGAAPTSSRAGDFRVCMKIPDVEQVNLCELDSSFLRHCEALTDERGIRDFIALINNDLPASTRPMVRRELRDRETPTGRYVLLTKDTL